MTDRATKGFALALRALEYRTSGYAERVPSTGESAIICLLFRMCAATPEWVLYEDPDSGRVWKYNERTCDAEWYAVFHSDDLASSTICLSMTGLT